MKRLGTNVVPFEGSRCYRDVLFKNIDSGNPSEHYLQLTPDAPVPVGGTTVIKFEVTAGDRVSEIVLVLRHTEISLLTTSYVLTHNIYVIGDDLIRNIYLEKETTPSGRPFPLSFHVIFDVSGIDSITVKEHTIICKNCDYPENVVYTGEFIDPLYPILPEKIYHGRVVDIPVDMPLGQIMGVATIDLSLGGEIHKISVFGDTIIEMINANMPSYPSVKTFEVHVDLTGVYPAPNIAWNNNIEWIGGVPAFNGHKNNVCVFRTEDGIRYIGNAAYSHHTTVQQ